jgi:2-polyprenyl-3-methyl-5-hydroxy-6-metoxy-1,4-benzoquinol methylase
VIKENIGIPKGDRGFDGERNDVTRSPDEKEKMVHLYRYQNVQETIKSNQRILDVGCGTGYGTQLLFNAGHETMGIDVSTQAIIYSNSSFPGPEYFIGNAESLPFKEGIFDVVTAFESIEHLQDADSGIKEIQRVLKKRGDLFISTPNPKHLKNVLKKIFFGIPIPKKVDMNNVYHIREFPYEEFLTFLQKNGFNIITVYGQGIPYVPVIYSKRIFDLAKYFPRYAWTIVIHAAKLD